MIIDHIWVDGHTAIPAAFRVGLARAGLGRFFAPYGTAPASSTTPVAHAAAVGMNDVGIVI